jgi:two-component system capsular synthesis response regulator RcsB
MFKSVLIAEDHESTSISLRKTLDDLGINHTYVYYCDDALSRVQKALRDGEPYDLLITDLSFEEDDHKQKLDGGEALVAAVRQVQADLKILVFSAEHRPAVIEGLFRDHDINGYVRKARRDALELKEAVESLFKGNRHFPGNFREAIKLKNTHEFTDFDVTIIIQLSRGMLQKDIPTYLQQNQIRPSGLSSIEKRLNLMKEALDFSNNEQLVAYCKDMGII